jgi:hypothetical protein
MHTDALIRRVTRLERVILQLIRQVDEQDEQLRRLAVRTTGSASVLAPYMPSAVDRFHSADAGELPQA